VNHPQIAVFARSATENTPYLRSIEGEKSLLGRTMHDIAFDGIHDEIVATSPLAQAILSFRGAASGEEAPLRVIQGDKTQIRAMVRKVTSPDAYVGAGATAKLTIDPVHNEILLASPDQDILVFDRMANGNVAPKRVLGGPDTQLVLGDQTPIRVDPIHNLLIVPSGSGYTGSKILVFDRTASGNTPPVGFIKGPVRMGEQFDIYAPTMKLVTHTNNNIEIWKIPQKGESDEPPVKIPAPLGRQSSDIGITLDPLHKEVIIATAAGNAIMTFYVPEVFDAGPKSPVISLARPN